MSSAYRRPYGGLAVWLGLEAPLSPEEIAGVLRFCRSKTSSTALERLMSMPLAKLDRLLGYGAVFAVVGAVAFGPLGLETGGAVWAVVLIAVANAVLGVSLGLFLSAFATSEFQAVQFMPAVVFPQSLLCGPLVPREQLPEVLEVVSAFLPLTYAYDALANITPDRASTAACVDLGVVGGSSSRSWRVR